MNDNKTIVTNLHVVQNADEVIVEFSDGRKFRAKGFIAYDENNDLITIRLPRKVRGVEPVKIGRVSETDVGLKVIAIGNPQGLSNTVSEGIVSAVRHVDRHTTVIQTTAAISPGSSGGGLFDLQSRLIGITSFLHTGGQNLNLLIQRNTLFHY